jgi:uncharacterized membrane protein YkvI
VKKEKMINALKFIFEPLAPCLVFLYIVAFLSLILVMVYIAVGGLTLCQTFGWPTWIGYTWLVIVLWGYCKLMYDSNQREEAEKEEAVRRNYSTFEY